MGQGGKGDQDPNSFVNSLLTKKEKSFVISNREEDLFKKKYALLRADGKCEKWDNNAPFEDKYGIPFLEVHHIFSLSDDGPDLPINVAAICPNCPKEAHFGITKEKRKNDLSQRILEKENAFSNKIISENIIGV